jgi:hypothetical protein
MPLIPSKLNFLPEFEGRDSLYRSILPEKREEGLKIRILTVEPNHDHLAPIEESLSIIASVFEEHEGYNAVSYYWGDINDIETIIIHGSDKGVPGLLCEVPVTKQLTAALRQFRARASADQEPLRLWIGALCINQTDARERQPQVRRMKWIFLTARNVRFWLGESNELVERGVATLFDYKTEDAATEPHSMSGILSPEEEISYIRQFAAVLALPYWRRGWTFQENMLPRKHIWYGKLNFKLRSWRLVIAACHVYFSRMHRKVRTQSFLFFASPLVSDSERDFMTNFGQLIATLAPFAFAEEVCEQAIMNAIKQLPDAYSLSGNSSSRRIEGTVRAQFLRNTFYRTSDPRDSVFALYEILPALASLSPDYTELPERIFSIATEALLRNTSDGLSDLQQWYYPQASPQLPSWVFDFTHCNIHVEENGYESFLSIKTTIGLDASAGSLFRVADCDGISIHAAGFIFDEILDISCLVDYINRAKSRWLSQLRSWMRLWQSHLPPRFASRQVEGTYTRSFMRTLGSDHGFEDYFTLDDLYFPGAVCWEDGPTKFLLAIIDRELLVRAAGNYEEFKKTVTLMAHIQKNADRARFFVTKGLWIGLAPLSAAIGDRTAILASGSAPFVLRLVSVDYHGEEADRIMAGCEVEGTVIRYAKFYSLC